MDLKRHYLYPTMQVSSQTKHNMEEVHQNTEEAFQGPPSVISVELPPYFISRMIFVNFHNEMIENKIAHVPGYDTLRPHVQHGIAPPILSLRPTTLKEVAMKVNHIHEDLILFVKTIYACHRIIGTNLLVEDDSRDCLLLSVYNFVPTNEDPNDIFPEQTYLAILAPYMKHSADDPTKNLLLRCDNPDCIRIFPSRRSWLAAKRGKKCIDTKGLDPALLKMQGNDAFVKDRYAVAARCYSRALECAGTISDIDRLSCHANLAEVRIRQELWEEAESSARAALSLDPTHTKAKFRLATALIRLQKFDEAFDVVTHEKETTFERQRHEIKVLLDEQGGIYNIEKMISEASKRPGERLATFHANFCSGKIQSGVAVTKRGGFVYRGTIATESIGSNVLVSSSKALVFCPPPSNSFVDPHSQSDEITRYARLDLENELVLLMHRRPQIRDHVYELTSGRELPKAPKDINRIDIARLQDIATTNTFNCDDWVEFSDAPDRLGQFRQSQSSAEYRPRIGSGLWVKESLFNHSCTPNCQDKQIGDQIFVFTTKSVRSGEELTISYVPGETPFTEREATFEDWTDRGIGFQCQCEWCHEVRNSEELKAADKRVSQAFKEAFALVKRQPIRVATAAEQVMPSVERKALLSLFSRLPIEFQHYSSLNLWKLEGACEMAQGNLESALRAHIKAAEIGYAVRGGFSVDWAVDQMAVAAASMACKKYKEALAILRSIYLSDLIRPKKGNKRESVFRATTLNHTMFWLGDLYSIEMYAAMEALIDQVIKECESSKWALGRASARHRKFS